MSTTTKVRRQKVDVGDIIYRNSLFYRIVPAPSPSMCWMEPVSADEVRQLNFTPPAGSRKKGWVLVKPATVNPELASLGLS